LGAGVASRLFDAQVNEVQARIAAMNRMTDLGMPMSLRVGVTASSPFKVQKYDFKNQ
jgi:hypothetical protein